MCFAAAGLLTFGYVLTRPIHVRDEMKSWRVLLGLFVFCFAGPYLYNEVMTRWHGPELDKAINAAVPELPVTGNLIYYKVTSFSGDKARVMAVFSEKLEWGGTDHPQYALNMEKEGGKWKTESFKVLNSERLNEETYVFPVYW